MRKVIIKKGDKYGKLTAVKFVKMDRTHQHWLFRCDCGSEKVISVNNVKRKMSKSCGCLDSKRNYKHGMRGTKIYNCWAGMKTRCLNKSVPEYKNYGGRGITVCKRWLKFENFYEDMGDRPERKSLDRINNDLGYYKENCRWASKEEQMNNTRRNHFLTFEGKTQNIAQWVKEIKMSHGTLRMRRIPYSWAIERISVSEQ